MFDMLGIGEQQRGIDQQRINQQLDTQMMPVDMLMQLVSGSPAGGRSRVQAQNPWVGMGQQAGQSMVQSAFSGGGGSSQDYYA
jgi:hypothetical protein